MKRVIIVHGWGGHPDEGWFPWLKEELESKSFNINIPEMPNKEKPEINAWVSKLSEIVGEPDEETYFLGHSIGCQTIMRYLASLPKDSKVGGAVFVAGFFNLAVTDMDKEEHEIAKPWLEIPIDMKKLKKICPKTIAIFSDNDPEVPLEDKEIFKEKLGSKIIVEHNRGHFTGGDDGITALTVALKSVLELAS
ncbi:MAG: DUF1749 domain-containing protein [Candidatus Nanoarchaeia archaeon]|nr:DUF1749 domain-containing protein [Candidatus Nanoarchaeia archaeon]